ncbi:MAG: dihydropteroate synthase [Vicinamibacteria bacterium]
MGVLNVTPDSFSDGGRALDPGRAAALALEMEAAGADLLDIGAESTRPGAPPLPADEERARLLPVLRRLRGQIAIPLSVDTYKADVARQALDEGAVIVNDVSGLEYDPSLGDVVAARGAALVLMHTRGRSSAMYQQAVYDDVVADVARELTRRVEAAMGRGVPWDSLILDPGIGFAKRAAESARVLARFDAFAALGRPLLAGPSRKSFLSEAAGGRPAAERDWATAGAVAAAALAGAHIVRVHHVEAMAQVARVADLLRAESAGGA